MSKQEEHDQNQSTFWFLLGAAAGVAAGYYLNSDSGRRIRNEAGEQISEYGKSISRSASGSAKQVKSYATDVGEAIRQKLDDLTETTESLRARLDEQFQAGKNSLRRSAKRLEQEAKK